MLSEAIRRQRRGEDVVVGIVETHGRPCTAELVKELHVMPRQHLEYRGVSFEEMDLDAILARPPSSSSSTSSPTPTSKAATLSVTRTCRRSLDAGIDVLTTVNVQHIESMTPRVQRSPASSARPCRTGS